LINRNVNKDLGAPGADKHKQDQNTGRCTGQAFRLNSSRAEKTALLAGNDLYLQKFIPARCGVTLQSFAPES